MIEVDRYEFVETADALLARVTALREGDKAAERAHGFWQGGCVISMLALFSSFWVIPALGPFGVPLPIVAIAVAILCARKMKVYGDRNLDDRKLEAFAKVVQVLRADVAANQQIRVTVDFREYRKGGETKPEGGWSHTWLRADTNLADGSAVNLALGEDVKRKERSKRKYTKVKERIVGEAAVDLRLPRQYGDATAIVERLRATAPPAGHTVAGLKGEGRHLHATLRAPLCLRLTGRSGTSTTGRLPDADTLLTALRWTYRGIAPTA